MEPVNWDLRPLTDGLPVCMSPLELGGLCELEGLLPRSAPSSVLRGLPGLSAFRAYPPSIKCRSSGSMGKNGGAFGRCLSCGRTDVGESCPEPGIGEEIDGELGTLGRSGDCGESKGFSGGGGGGRGPGGGEGGSGRAALLSSAFPKVPAAGVEGSWNGKPPGEGLLFWDFFLDLTPLGLRRWPWALGSASRV